MIPCFIAALASVFGVKPLKRYKVGLIYLLSISSQYFVIRSISWTARTYAQLGFYPTTNPIGSLITLSKFSDSFLCPRPPTMKAIVSLHAVDPALVVFCTLIFFLHASTCFSQKFEENSDQS
ncbi:hypothetical protein P167DRAFT_534127 [Morchella conica CCBAS932]|uniref:Uncharacterized protein n=1 Tax=Morchella conica CCBAS932 TaxID=1392247 RepID=A0A3N4KYF2_9PEZI|nr:hypothetical protein P167DRAFT_534127 [Morchella conica CCBAS932]